MTTQNNFKDFSNKFALTKTLRFELRHVKLNNNKEELKMQKNMDEAWGKIEQKEREINKLRAELKEVIDNLHQEFIKDLIDEYSNKFDISKSIIEKCGKTEKDDYKIYLSNDKEATDATCYETKNDKNVKECSCKAYPLYFIFDRINKGGQDEKKKFRKLFTDAIQALGKDFAGFAKTFISNKYKGKNTKGKDVNLNVANLTSGQLYFLLENYLENKEEYKDIKEKLKLLKGMTGVLKDLAANRKHYYQSGGKHGQITTRIFNENLEIFLKNKLIYEDKIKEHVKIDDASVFDLNEYFKKWIKEQERYNEKIAEFNKN